MVMHALPRNFRLSVEFESCALLHAAGRLGRPPPSLLGRRDVGCAHDLRLPPARRRSARACLFSESLDSEGLIHWFVC